MPMVDAFTPEGALEPEAEEIWSASPATRSRSVDIASPLSLNSSASLIGSVLQVSRGAGTEVLDVVDDPSLFFSL